jgi:hypothetical protein
VVEIESKDPMENLVVQLLEFLKILRSVMFCSLRPRKALGLLDAQYDEKKVEAARVLKSYP